MALEILTATADAFGSKHSSGQREPASTAPAPDNECFVKDPACLFGLDAGSDSGDTMAGGPNATGPVVAPSRPPSLPRRSMSGGRNSSPSPGIKPKP
jgi:hypothetical protein